MALRDRIERTRGTALHPTEQVERDAAGALRMRLVNEVDLGELLKMNPTQRRARLERVVGRMLSEDGPVLADEERRALIRRVVDEALGLGVLEPLLDDESVTEIMVNSPDDIWVERDGRLERVSARFTGEAQLYQTIDRIVSTVNRRVDESSPMVDARLPSGERVNVIIPPLSLTGPTLTIRRFPKPYTIEELTGLESLDEAMATLLATCVRARLSMVISGGTGAGKTTLLNALSGFIPPSERIITVEDSAELQLQQPHVISLEARPSNVEGKGEVRIRDLVRNSLRMRPDRIIVGEVRGAETLDMLQAMNTGHEGSLVTVHANSAEDAIVRLETLASMSDVVIPFDAIRDQIRGAVEIVVQLARGPDGRRRVVEIAAVASPRRDVFKLQTIARFEAEPIGPDRAVRGRFRTFTLPKHIERALLYAGEALPEKFAGSRDGAPERDAEGEEAVPAPGAGAAARRRAEHERGGA
jgi:pilus assembly protein CpaF